MASAGAGTALMTMRAIEKLEAVGVIPVATIQTVDIASHVMDALIDGGLPAIEITFRSEAAVDTIRKLVQMKDDVLLAAGTVVNTDKAERAIDAGAQVIVSPGTFPDVIQCCFERDIQVLPGVATATEVGTALGLGANVLKFFPAELSGGVATLKAFGAVYPGVRFVPTGGISALNLEAYLSAPEVLACGGSWLVNPGVVDRGGYDRIAQMAREAVAIVQAIRGKRRRRAATS